VACLGRGVDGGLEKTDLGGDEVEITFGRVSWMWRPAQWWYWGRKWAGRVVMKRRGDNAHPHLAIGTAYKYKYLLC